MRWTISSLDISNEKIATGSLWTAALTAIPSARRSFAHRRSCRDDHQIGRLETGQLLVEIDVAGRQTGQLRAPLLEQLDVLQHVTEQRSHFEERLGAPSLRHREDRLLRPVHHTCDLLVDVEGDIGHGGSGPDQLAALGVLFDDPGVVEDVGGRGDDVYKTGQVGDSPDLVQFPPASQCLGHGHGVDGLVGVEQLPHRLEDRLVGGDIEVRRMEAVHHLVDRLFREEHRPYDRLLSLPGVGRAPETRSHLALIGDAAHLCPHQTTRE